MSGSQVSDVIIDTANGAVPSLRITIDKGAVVYWVGAQVAPLDVYMAVTATARLMAVRALVGVQHQLLTALDEDK